MDHTPAGGTDSADDSGSARPRRATRRRVLATAGLVGAASLAGCGLFGDAGTPTATTTAPTDGNDTNGNGADLDLTDFRGSGPLVAGRGDPGGTPIAELPPLEGNLNFYLGGGEGGLYLQLIRRFEDIYPDFSFDHNLESSASLANQIIEETRAATSPADLFLSVDAGSLGAIAEAGAAATLPSAVTEPVPSAFKTDQWVGIAGRARAIPYNTEALDAADIPDTVQAFPGDDTFANAMGWAPTYSAFQSFITAMRELRGDSATREWLNGMQQLGVSTFPDEFRVSNAVADGELRAGFANHYYALRVRNARPDAPIDLAFTSNDAGALINVSGAAVIQGTDDADLAQTFIRHLLSREAQEFFATTTFAYPTVENMQPPGGLPTIDELNPPDVSLTALSDVEGTLELLRQTGVL